MRVDVECTDVTATKVPEGRFFETDGDAGVFLRVEDRAIQFIDGETPYSFSLEDFDEPVELIPESYAITIGGA